MQLLLIEPASRQPVSLEEFKRQTRVETSDEDAFLGLALQAAINKADGRYGALGRALLTSTWEFRRRSFWSGYLPLPLAAPLQQVDSIKYLDGDGTERTVNAAAYVTDTASEPGRVSLAPDYSWPTDLYGTDDSVRIRYRAGWETVEAIPAEIRQGILLLAADMYRNREATSERSLSEIPVGVRALWGSFKIHRLSAEG